MNYLTPVGLAVLCALGSCQVLAQQQLSRAGHPLVEQIKIADQYIVVFHKNTPGLPSLQQQQQWTQQQVDLLVNQTGVTVQQQYSHSISGALVIANAQQLKALRQHAAVAYIEPNRKIQLAPMLAGAQVNPPWGLDRIDQRQLPLNQQFNPAQTGQAVTAFVIDTGVMINHSDFGGRASNGYDFIDNDNVAQDCNGHGTHVAGTIAGTEYGVAKQANVVGVRVLGCNGSGTTAGVIAGVNWVAAQANGQPKVANMSLGGGASQALDDAVNAAVDRGILFVVAAGNSNNNACGSSPARAAKAFTVGSTTNTDQRSSFSSYGNCLKIFAPGSDIKSAWNNGGSNTISGTSMAAPHVAGAAALYLQANPAQTPAQLAQTLINTATPNVVGNAGAGSPNRLVYTEGGTAEPPPALQVTLSGARNSDHYYSLNVPAGKGRLTVKTSGGSGDVDLYVMHNDRPDPILHSCASENPDTNQEQCLIQSPQSGDWQILVYGYTAFTNVTLTASYQ